VRNSTKGEGKREGRKEKKDETRKMVKTKNGEWTRPNNLVEQRKGGRLTRDIEGGVGNAGGKAVYKYYHSEEGERQGTVTDVRGIERPAGGHRPERGRNGGEKLGGRGLMEQKTE